jgi:Na+/proline symporter
MSLLDFVVLIGSMVGIAAYGIWRTRGKADLSTYLKGDATIGWATIGISVMATQASAITFISTPGQGYASGLSFVQNYFGMPLALIIIAAIFLPIYHRLKVYTAYEFLGRRFDSKTRLLGAALFLLQRGLNAGITIYAPAIILSTVLGWRLDITILLSGALVIAYTVAGGSRAVTVTHKYQMAVILGGMIAAFVILLLKLPAGLSDAFTIAGGFHRLEAVDFSPDPHKRYTFWSGTMGGIFLMLAYFGTDQSQVQRYLSGASVRESRLGLMFNAVLKIPMQFLLLLLGVMMFVFYQFEPAPILFNQSAWRVQLQHDTDGQLHALEGKFATASAEKKHWITAWMKARQTGNLSAAAEAQGQAQAAHQRGEDARVAAQKSFATPGSPKKSNDADFVFITFILNQLPHGLIGLLMAAFFAAALSSKSAELTALGSTTTIDFYRHLVKREATDAHFLMASKLFTLFWGLVALSFALLANMAENLIQAANILGSLFYGVVLGLFLVAFFFRRVGGTAVFWAGVVAQGIVVALHFSGWVSYLWYNPIGCCSCVGLSLLFQLMLGGRACSSNSIAGGVA